MKKYIGWTTIALLALASSITSITNGFTYDDIHIIKDNPSAHSLHNFWHLFLQGYWRDAGIQTLYRPLTMLGFAAQWTAGNGSPMVFHATNIVLYMLVCVVFYWFVRMLFREHNLAAWSCAALFAVHPVHVEAVGNLVGQSELTCGIVMILGMGLYINWRREGELTVGRMLVLAALYLTACLFKEHGILLIALFLIAEIFLVPKYSTKAANLRPFFLALIALALFFVYFRSLILGEMQGDFPHAACFEEPWSTRFWTMGIVVLEWLRLFFWPASLSADYAPNRIRVYHGPVPEMFVTLLIFISVITLGVYLHKRAPVVTFGLLWVAITLSLVSNILFPSGVMLAERTLFLPSAGILIAVTALAVFLKQHSRYSVNNFKVVFSAVLIVLLGLGVVHSARRQRIWYDNKSLFTSMLDDSPTDYRAQWSFASALYKSGHEPEAIRVLESAYRTFPRDPALLDELGYRYKSRGDCGRAIPLFRRSLEMSPIRSITRGRLAMCLLKVGKRTEAWTQALEGMKDPLNAKNAIVLVRVVKDSLRADRGAGVRR